MQRVCFEKSFTLEEKFKVMSDMADRSKENVEMIINGRLTEAIPGGGVRYVNNSYKQEGINIKNEEPIKAFLQELLSQDVIMPRKMDSRIFRKIKTLPEEKFAQLVLSKAELIARCLEVCIEKGFTIDACADKVIECVLQDSSGDLQLRSLVAVQLLELWTYGEQFIDWCKMPKNEKSSPAYSITPNMRLQSILFTTQLPLFIKFEKTLLWGLFELF